MSARIIIIAINRVKVAISIPTVVSGTSIIIITNNRIVHTISIDTGINCARVIVVTINRFMNTDSIRASVICAWIVVITVDRSIDAVGSTVRIARVYSASIQIVAWRTRVVTAVFNLKVYIDFITSKGSMDLSYTFINTVVSFTSNSFRNFKATIMSNSNIRVYQYINKSRELLSYKIVPTSNMDLTSNNSITINRASKVVDSMESTTMSVPRVLRIGIKG
jgi:hypothetical protein